MCVCVCVCVLMYVCMCVCAVKDFRSAAPLMERITAPKLHAKYAKAREGTCVYVCVCVCMCVCVCVCVCVYV